MLVDVTFCPREISGKHEEGTEEPQTRQQISGRTILPEQPIKEQNKSFACLLIAFASSVGAVIFAVDVADAI
jgi:hypothetical protein